MKNLTAKQEAALDKAALEHSDALRRVESLMKGYATTLTPLKRCSLNDKIAKAMAKVARAERKMQLATANTYGNR